MISADVIYSLFPLEAFKNVIWVISADCYLQNVGTFYFSKVAY